MASDWFGLDDDLFSSIRRIRGGGHDAFSLEDDFFSKASHWRNRFSRRDPDFLRFSRSSDTDSPSPSSSRVSFHTQQSTEGGSRKSSVAGGQVSFPPTCSSTLSDDKSDIESVCTERSATRNAEREILPDGTEQKIEKASETWKEQSAAGDLFRQGTTNQTLTTETKPGLFQEKNQQETYFVETDGPNSSKRSVKTSETVSRLKKSNSFNAKSEGRENQKATGRPFRVPPNRSIFYDELDSLLLNRKNRRQRIFDHLDLDGFFEDGLKTRRKLVGNDKETFHRDIISELQRENETLRQENSKLQAAIQDVTLVNKRWQTYNNDRRVYEQKLLATIQDLQLQLKEKNHEHLEMQLRAFKDDFEAERREKQKAEEENLRLREEVKGLRQDLVFLKVNLEEKRETPSPTRTFLTKAHLPFKGNTNSDSKSIYLGFPDNGLATVHSFNASNRLSPLRNTQSPLEDQKETEKVPSTDAVASSDCDERTMHHVRVSDHFHRVRQTSTVTSSSTDISSDFASFHLIG